MNVIIYLLKNFTLPISFI